MKNTKYTAIERFTEVAENLDFSVSVYEDNGDIEIGKYSPAGQDFSVSFYVDTETMNGTDETAYREIIDALEERAHDFDPDEEASLWIGDDGHGVNGAPYHIKDIIEDMETCKRYLFELVDELKAC